MYSQMKQQATQEAIQEWKDSWKESAVYELYRQFVQGGADMKAYPNAINNGEILLLDSLIAYCVGENSSLRHTFNEIAVTMLSVMNDSVKKNYQNFVESCIEYILIEDEAYNKMVNDYE